MTLKEKFLKIKTHDEFDSRKDEFKDLDFHDEDVVSHYDEIFKNDFKNGIITEVFKHPKK